MIGVIDHKQGLVESDHLVENPHIQASRCFLKFLPHVNFSLNRIPRSPLLTSREVGLYKISSFQNVYTTGRKKGARLPAVRRLRRIVLQRIPRLWPFISRAFQKFGSYSFSDIPHSAYFHLCFRTGNLARELQALQAQWSRLPRACPTIL